MDRSSKILPYHSKEHEKEKQQAPTNGAYENYDPVREKFSYAIAVQLFLVYLIYLYYESINYWHPLLAGLLLGGQSSCMAQSLNQFYHRDHNLIKHVKFYIWGMINGLLTTLWISVLIANVDSNMVKFFLDQTVGTFSFQFVFVVYNCLWERQNLVTHLKTTYVQALKYSYMIWPLVSFLSFNYVQQETIFPLNCFCNLIFTVVLAILT